VYGRPDAAMVSWAYHNAFAGLMRHPDVSSIGGTLVLNCDLVRARSRIVRMFLETDNTDLLMWDADVAPKDMNAIHAMVASEKDMIALPYPRKSIHWEVIADNVRDEHEQAVHGRQTGSELEGYGLDWPLRILDQKHVDGIARVSEVGLGFTLIRRHALERMCDHYRGELGFLDNVEGQRHATVALFQLFLKDGDLLSEDYSFCRRWRDIGGEVHVLIDPARHIGTHAFGGAL
jgi:hypothetical protein